MAKYLEGTLYQRSDTGAWVYETKVLKPDGFYRIKTISSPLKRTTQEKAKAFEATRGQQANRVVTLIDHYQSWILHCESRCAKKTIRSYRQMMEVRVLPLIGGMRLTSITAKHIDELLSTLKSNGHTGGDYSARGINMAREVLRNCMNVAVRWGLITTNPVILTKTVTGESYVPPAIGEDEFLLVREALSSSHHDRRSVT